MSNFLFENALLTLGLQATASQVEWEGSSLLISGALSTLSMEFFFSYFHNFTTHTTLSPLAAAEFDAYYNGVALFPASFIGGSVARQWGFLNLLGAADALHVLIAKAALALPTPSLPAQLYADLVRSFAAVTFPAFFAGSQLATATISSAWLYELSYAFDWALVILELAAFILLVGISGRITGLFAQVRIFYDDIATFCVANNISAAEVGVFFSFFLGFIAFDLFLCAGDEDVTDVFSYFMVTFVALLFFFLILGIDVQYYYMISSVSSGDLTARVVAFDIINNFLCILRIFFCWVRYIFYDLQVELVDFSFHYTDAVNEMTTLNLYDAGTAGAWFGDFFTQTTDSTVLATARSSWFLLVYLYVDVCFIVIQMLVGFVKLFIAFFLLWLIVDLFILKAFAHAESTYLARLRTRLAHTA